MAAQSEVRDLLTKINATKKYKAVKSGSKHHKVVYAEGPQKNKPVVDANGVLIISATPGEVRWREMTVKRLLAAKVLDSDPYKKTPTGGDSQNGDTAKKKGGKNHPFSDPERAAAINAAKLAAIDAKSKKAREETAQLRARLEPVVIHLGGWGGRGGRFNVEIPMEERMARTLSLTELAAVAHHWAFTRGRMEAPRVKGTTQIVDVGVFHSAATQVKLPGHTLGDSWRPFWTAFIDELYSNAGTGADAPRKAASRYWELYREMKGVPVREPATPPGGPAAAPSAPPGAREDAEPETAAEEPLRIGPAYDSPLPALAFEALWLMAKGTDDYDKAMSVAEKIAKLELERGTG